MGIDSPLDSASGMTRLGHDAVLAHEVGEHVPLAAVLDGVLQQEADQAAVGRLVGGGDHGLEEPVGLLELVVELQVGLRELELVDLEALHGLDAQHVQPGEHPAAAALLLVGDLGRLDDVREGALGGAHDRLAVARHDLHLAGRDGVQRQPVARLGGEGLVEARDGRGLQGAARAAALAVAGARVAAARRQHRRRPVFAAPAAELALRAVVTFSDMRETAASGTCPLPRLPLPFALSRVVARDFVRAAVSLLTCRLLGWMRRLYPRLCVAGGRGKRTRRPQAQQV